MLALLVRCLTGGNDADSATFDFDMHHVQQSAEQVVTDDPIACFFVAADFNQTEERVKEDRRCLLEGDSIVLAGIGRSLLRVPDEGCSIQLVASIYENILNDVFTLSIHIGSLLLLGRSQIRSAKPVACGFESLKS